MKLLRRFLSSGASDSVSVVRGFALTDIPLDELIREAITKTNSFLYHFWVCYLVQISSLYSFHDATPRHLSHHLERSRNKSSICSTLAWTTSELVSCFWNHIITYKNFSYWVVIKLLPSVCSPPSPPPQKTKTNA